MDPDGGVEAISEVPNKDVLIKGNNKVKVFHDFL